MRVLITGAGGHIGSAVVAELVGAGHDALGLVRSEVSAGVVSALGATVLRGDVNDLDLLRSTASEVDAVIHLAYDNASVAAGDMTTAAQADTLVVQAFGDALAGTGKTFMGIGIATTGDAELDRAMEGNPRTFVAREVAKFGARGIRSLLVAIPPVTHSDRDHHGFIPMIIAIARRTGVSGYVAAGENHWPAVHTVDLARLYRLALEGAPAGAQLMGAAEPGVETRGIAEAIGRGLDLRTQSFDAQAAAEHFAPFLFMDMDITMPNAATRAMLGWEPTHPTLLQDLEAGHYFATEEAAS